MRQDFVTNKVHSVPLILSYAAPAAPSMTPQQTAILDRLSEAGWELAGPDDVDQWWADEVWRMRSVWSHVRQTALSWRQ